jgi:glycosyltransferase involved in cell wall biosynthesis
LINFTIITPVRNGAKTIRDCVQSVRAQSLPAQHIIVDGHSTDETMKIIKTEYADCTETLSESDYGLYDAMNKGLQMARGDVIGILNSDDYYASSDVLASVAKLFVRSNFQSCYGDLVYVNRNHPQRIARYWRSGEYAPQLFYNGWMPPHPTFFVRQEVYEKHGNFNLALGSSADYEIMLRFLLKNEISVAYLPKILVYMRTGGTSGRSLWVRILANLSDRKAWRINHLKPRFWTLLMKPARKLPQFFRRPKCPSDDQWIRTFCATRRSMQ